jgi:hypothetical protein
MTEAPFILSSLSAFPVIERFNCSTMNAPSTEKRLKGIRITFQPDF